MLNVLKQSKCKAVLAFIIAALLINVCCGKRKPPLPPIEKTQQGVEISGIQRGNKIILSWTFPIRAVSSGSSLDIVRTDIYRLIEPVSSPLTLSEEEFSSESVLIASLPISGTTVTNDSKKMIYFDSLEFAGQSARIRYAIRFVNSSGQKAAFSNFLLIEPAAKIAQSPNHLKSMVAENSIRLNWEAPVANIDESKPANILGYNIYRLTGNETVKVLNNEPVRDTVFLDELFEFGTPYRYFIRTVSLGNNGEPKESEASDPVEVIARDIFPPSAPGAITIAAAPNNLSIFFAFNSEKDIAGYKIFRTEISALPKSEWTLLTVNLLTTNTFQDTAVESGKTYFYYLVAVDKAQNVSQPSEVFSETAP